MNLDLGHVARDLGIPLDRIQRTVSMLDEGNTVPFITRYRKDQTGGLDEEAIRSIQERISRLRLLAERKQSILKSIEAQGKLTPELANQINHADSIKRLEDLYLPYKPKKQTLATKAREQGLEPLALEVLNADPAASDLEARARDFISPEKGLPGVAEVLQGVGHLLAEKFGERADVRGRLRRILWRTGKLVSTRIEPAEKPDEAQDSPSLEAAAPHAAPAQEPAAALAQEQPPQGDPAAESPLAAEATPAEASESTQAESVPDVPQSGAATDVPPSAAEPAAPLATEPPALEAALQEPEPATTEAPALSAAGELPAVPSSAPEPAADGPAASSAEAQPASAAPAAASLPQESLKSKRKKKKKKKEPAPLDAAFKDYFNYQEPLSHIPPHRVLAINRGERAKVLRVKIDVDLEAMYREAEGLLVPPEHPHAELLRECLRDALSRLIFPSLERESRREMTEKSEQHAVDVFVRNLRKLLLQPPVSGRRVLAVDPGFKSGCKLAALDEFGNVLGHVIIHVVGNEERRKRGREQMADMIRSLELSVVAIGNGAACREAEQLVADLIAGELADRDVQYVVVNEAGASVYSTSPIGREEFPGYDPLLRSAISIGRRLLDPLSELVKINPANIGVGLYQHDVKAKHLRESLDAVVESAVNYVGVDVNTASPALLRYVSGLNQLTARRLYEYRCEHGPFKNREQFKSVPGFGDATFVQAAGFLKILGGDNPLDATWIHPESYEVAQRVLERLNSDIKELAHIVPAAPQPRKPAPLAKVVNKVASATAQTPALPPEPETILDDPPSAATMGVGADLEGTEAALAPEQAAAKTLGQESAEEMPAEEMPAEEKPAEQMPASAAPDSAAPPAPLQEEPYASEGPVEGDAESAAPAATAAGEEAAELSAAALSGHEAQAQGSEPTAPRQPSLAERAAQADPAALAQELAVGELLLCDILASLSRPGRDPREDLAPPIFRRGIMKLEDLQAGMELQGTVLNVVDFGAFVDIGLSDSGLVHISRLADRYVKDPHDVVGVGDVLKVWVVEVDKQRRRVSLTAIEPGTERPPQPKRERPPREKGARPPRRPPARAPQAGGPGQPPASAPGAPQAERGPSRPSRPPRTSRPVAAAGGAPQGSSPPSGISRPPLRAGKGARDPAPTVGSKKMLGKQLSAKKKLKPKQSLTPAMEEGREPMRSFSDLLKFVKKKSEGSEEKP